MRSRTEALFAQHLDAVGLDWSYEPVAFGNERGQYLPDFEITLPAGRAYIEVKPDEKSASQSIDDLMPIIWDSDPDAILLAFYRLTATDRLSGQREGAWAGFTDTPKSLTWRQLISQTVNVASESDSHIAIVIGEDDRWDPDIIGYWIDFVEPEVLDSEYERLTTLMRSAYPCVAHLETVALTNVPDGYLHYVSTQHPRSLVGDNLIQISDDVETDRTYNHRVIDTYWTQWFLYESNRIVEHICAQPDPYED